MAVTQKDIARASGISVTAVSFVLTGRAEEMHLSKATIRRVQAAAARLGFTPNYHAQSLSTGRARTLGLIAGNDSRALLHHFWSPVAAGVGAHACERGYHVLIMADGERSAVDTVAGFLQQKRIDGLIALAYPALPVLRLAPKVPVVLIGVRNRGRASVMLDDAAGIDAAVRHAVELGHRDLLFIGAEGRGDEISARRSRAFRAAARRAGITGRLLTLIRARAENQPVDFHIARYREQLAAQRRLPPGTTAAICYNDNVALALCSVLAERGVRVPDDVSVIGFDDMYAASANPPLTTVSHMLPEMGATAVDLLLDMIERMKPPRGVTVTPRLIIRASTAVARKRGRS
jgi:DNA-binding LacI/PurR family transcriptional regulator